MASVVSITGLVESVGYLLIDNETYSFGSPHILYSPLTVSPCQQVGCWGCWYLNPSYSERSHANVVAWIYVNFQENCITNPGQLLKKYASFDENVISKIEFWNIMRWHKVLSVNRDCVVILRSSKLGVFIGPCSFPANSMMICDLLYSQGMTEVFFS